MASQIGTTRIYTTQSEATSPRKVTCDKCKVQAVPKGVLTTRGIPTGQEKFCPNCGHIHRAGAGRDNH